MAQIALAPLGHEGAAVAVKHCGRLQAWSAPAAQVHRSCAPGSTVIDAILVNGSVTKLSPETLQSGPVPQDGSPAPAKPHIGTPVMHTGLLPAQKRLVGAAPEIYKNDEH